MILFLIKGLSVIVLSNITLERTIYDKSIEGFDIIVTFAILGITLFFGLLIGSQK